MSPPRRVVLCGSTRSHFLPVFQEVNLRETLAGNIVLTIGCDTKSNVGLSLTETDKFHLDVLHFQKIDLADEVIILNVGGYVGISTKRELVYALEQGKPVFFYAAFRPDPEYPYAPMLLCCSLCHEITFVDPFRVPVFERLWQTGQQSCGHPLTAACVHSYVSRYPVRFD